VFREEPPTPAIVVQDLILTDVTVIKYLVHTCNMYKIL
jgi:hypothetical protein